MPRAGLTRERVVAEAAVVADEVGFERLTLAAVAERFDVALPSLYKHVSGVDGLRHDLAVAGMAELAKVMGSAAIGVVRRDALVAVANAYRRFAQDRPGLYAASVRAPEAGDEAHEAVAAQALAVVFAVMRSYGIEGADAVHGIRALRSALHGFVTMESAGGFGMPEAVDESFRRMIDLFDESFSRQGR